LARRNPIDDDRVRRIDEALARQRGNRSSGHCRKPGDADDLAAADSKIDAAEIGAERVFGGERQIAHFEQSVAARGRGAVLRMRQVVADHQARKIGAALPARIAIAGDSSGAQDSRAVAQGADLVELVTDVEDRAAFVGQAPECRTACRSPPASAPTSARP
jgi:hypothetical protein